jgi:hypothetical protein
MPRASRLMRRQLEDESGVVVRGPRGLRSSPTDLPPGPVSAASDISELGLNEIRALGRRDERRQRGTHKARQWDNNALSRR